MDVVAGAPRPEMGVLPLMKGDVMKTYKNPKGLEMKPCLNCVSISLLEKECPCPNHTGNIYRENGKIVEFSCENRIMHEGFPNATEKPPGTRKTEKKSRVHGNGLSKREIIKKRLQKIKPEV